MVLYRLRALDRYTSDKVREELAKAIFAVHGDREYVRVKYVCAEITGKPDTYPMFTGIADKDIKALLSTYATEQNWKRVVNKQTSAVFWRGELQGVCGGVQ